MWCRPVLTDLSGCVWLLVAGQYLQHHAAACLLQHLLQHFGVVAHLFAIHLLDNVAHMEQALLIDHSTVEDPGNHQLPVFHSERHSLHTRLFHILKVLQGCACTASLTVQLSHLSAVATFKSTLNPPNRPLRLPLKMKMSWTNTNESISWADSPGARRTLCECQPSWLRLGGQAGYSGLRPWTNRGWGEGSRSFWKPQSREFPGETES